MSVPSAIQDHAASRPDHPALVVADGPTLGYGELHHEIDGIAGALSELGVGPRDTIGIALRDGPVMAITFLGVSAVAAAAPLNPSYRAAEFDFEIDDLSLAAMVVGTGADEIGAAVEAARAAGIPVIRVRSTPPLDDRRFPVEVSGERLRPDTGRASPAADDVALVLHTSGTTSRPKIVPLSHANIAASAGAIADTVRLTPDDRVCNVMPLFHIHGLIAGLCTSLAAGATVVATPGFSAADMGRWLTEHDATWYTAVPTMHQALLERRASAPEEFADVRLRFIRSSSSSLAPTVMADLERAFSCPVIESYGMTEATHQMASNPLPPAVRKPGSVGPAAGPSVAVMDAAGALLGVGEVGEIVIQGPNVTAGYHDNPEANASAFSAGWFRTGDQGRMDEDGYVFLTGRLKEIINRGGEKVSPREIDEILLAHADVAQVVTFAVSDERLGEQVAAAVVPAPGATASERELRDHVATKVAPYKVPRRIVFLDEIPKGPSGKLRRIGLAEQLGLADLDRRERPAEHVAAATAAELLMAELWGEVLGRSDLSVHEHFLDAGGDSLAATRLLTRVREEIDVEISMLDFFDAPTIGEQGALVEAALLAGDVSE